jgi:hypothetical protein
MCLHASLDRVLKEREKIAEELIVSSKKDKISTTFDVVKSLVYRLDYFRAMNTNARVTLRTYLGVFNDRQLTIIDGNLTKLRDK